MRVKERRTVFRPNLETSGRQLRAAASLALAATGALVLSGHTAVGIILFVGAAFLLFEALRGWCALRACGVRTRF